MTRTRLKKAWCEKCGYTIRVTMKWIMKHVPICPVCRVNMQIELYLKKPNPKQFEKDIN